MGDQRDETQESAAVALFDDETAEERIRRVWHDGRWFFSVIDVVGALTDAPKPRMYWADMKRRIQAEGFRETLSNCRQLKLPSPSGKSYETDCADFATMMSLLFAMPAWKRSMRRHVSHGAKHDVPSSGIHAISNMLTQEQYVGSSRDIPARFNQHRALLLQGKHHAKRLQEAWDRYGEECFRFEILESVSDAQDLESLEQQYLSECKSPYNSSAVATNSAAATPIPEARFHAVLKELYDVSGYGKSDPIFSTVRDAIVMGALRPGPNFHLVSEAEDAAVQGCEELSAFIKQQCGIMESNRNERELAMSGRPVMSPENYRTLTTQSDHSLWSQPRESAPSLPTVDQTGEEE